MRFRPLLAFAAAAPAAGQVFLVPAPPPPVVQVPVFLSELRPVPALVAPPAAAAPPVGSVSAKPSEAKAKRILVERHYLPGKAGVTPLPERKGRADDPEFDQIIREFYFTETANPPPAAAGPKEVPLDGAKPPDKMALPPAPKHSTAEPESEFGAAPKVPAAPAPAEADRKPNGDARGYPPAKPGPLDGVESRSGKSDALSLAAAPVTGLAKSPRGATPYAECELRFLHHAVAGKRHAEQSCKSDRKGEFATNLEPGLWTVFLALPEGEGFEKLGSFKVTTQGPNVFRMGE